MNIECHDFDSAIARIRVGYVTTLKEYLEQLTLLGDMITAHDTRTAALGEVRAIAHKIHGVAKTLRYDELGLIAAEVEYVLSPAPQGKLSAEESTHASARISDMQACISTICANADSA